MSEYKKYICHAPNCDNETDETFFYCDSNNHGLCDNCNNITAITFEPYGASLMAVIDCPMCGVSYDTNLDPADVKAVQA